MKNRDFYLSNFNVKVVIRRLNYQNLYLLQA